MTTLDIPIQEKTSGLAKIWQRIPMLIGAILMAYQPKFVRSNSNYEISQ